MKRSFPLKLLAFFLAVISLTGAAILFLWQVANWNAIWTANSPRTYDHVAGSLLYQDSLDIINLIDFHRAQAVGITFEDWEEDQFEAQEQALSAEKTNVRWQVFNRNDHILFSNTTQIPPRNAGLYNCYAGWSEYYHLEEDPEGLMEDLYIRMWVDEDMAVEDNYARLWHFNDLWRDMRVPLLAGSILLAVLGLFFTVLLCLGCGHKKGCEGIHLHWFHRIPGDLLTLVMAGSFLLLCVPVVELSNGFLPIDLTAAAVLLCLCFLAMAALVVGYLATFVTRCKAHVLLRDTLIWRFFAWIGRGCRRVGMALPLIWKVALAGCVYLFLSLIFNGWVWLILTLLLLAYLCWWAWQWKLVRQGAHQIIAGDAAHHIDTAKMPPDLKAHGDELNRLGDTIAAAVDDRLRSEHFRAELITNVSHDLKTPLTSIINYVDLLKQENLDDPRIAGYIEVLDRKSQRLKKLTEDLVEASKASTGVLHVEKERLDLVQLTRQAVAEYEDRLAACRLTAVLTLPEEPVWVNGDGRHLWRVMDNLLSNCAKYALEHSRVYVQVENFPDRAVLWVKNISREPLNVPPERLLERFVRGDEARSAEGSGLGLSIAQSLTDLQSGQFELSIDGDLFKAAVTLPKTEA